MGELLTTGQAARVLGLSRTTIRDAIKRGTLRCAMRTGGGHARLAAEEVERYRRNANAAPLDIDYRSVLDAFADAMIAADTAGTIVHVNSAIAQLLGWSSSELTGKPLTSIIPTRLRAAHHAGFERYMATGASRLIGRTARVAALRRDGGEVEIELALSTLHLPGRQTLIVAALRDLQERVELERQAAASRYLRATTAAAARLTSYLDAERVIQSVADTMATEFDAALARIWLIDAERQALRMSASAGTAAEPDLIPGGIIDLSSPHPLAQVACSRDIFISNNLSAISNNLSAISNNLSAAPDDLRAWAEREGIVALAIVPLVMVEEVQGVLAYFSRTTLGDELIEALGAFAAIAAASLRDTQLYAREQAAREENARLYEAETELRRRAEEHAHRIAYVQRAGEQLKVDLDERGVGLRVVHAAREALGFRMAVLNLVDRPGAPDARGRVVATAGIPPEGETVLTANDFPISDIEVLFTPARRLSRSYFIPFGSTETSTATDIPTWTPALHNDGPNAWHAGDEFMVPLTDRDGGHLLGFISVDDPENGRRPQRAEAEVLEIFADQAVVALRNARLMAEARRQAERDAVTGLLNHRAAQARLATEFAAARVAGEPLGLLALDVDDFKMINDTHGHQAGDMALRHVAALLERCARDGDVAARLGGDEFMLILPGAAREQSIAVAERLTALATNAALWIAGADLLPLRLSIGVAAYPDDAEQPHGLLTIADRRLYEAKRAGGRAVEAGRGPDERGDDLAGFDMLSALVTAVDNKDRYTREHSEQVAGFACILADALGLSPETQRTLRLAGLLHDVGKIGVPDRVLRKPGRLDPDEWEAMKQHVSLSETLVRAVGGDPDVLAAVAHHHERWDGKGYPRGIAGTQVPLLGRIMIVADAVSAMAMDRSYRRGLSSETLVAELRKGAGSQFDPTLVEPFIAALVGHDRPLVA